MEKILGLSEDAEGVSSPGTCVEGEGSGSEPALLRRRAFLAASKSRLEMWVQWLLGSQQGPVQGSFRWRGRDDGREKLLATTFASGLDDYPRASEPGEVRTRDERDWTAWCRTGRAGEGVQRWFKRVTG